MLMELLQQKTPMLWINSGCMPVQKGLPELPLGMKDIEDAAERLDRFAPLLQYLFPELEDAQGIIESPLLSVPKLQKVLLGDKHKAVGNLYIKADHSLPVAGSVKARGGIYEVLVIAEKIAQAANLFEDDYSSVLLASEGAEALFAKHCISVGSTGNLGLSIGVMAAALGFNAVVHMSADAKAWKKERLRKCGVSVIEHSGDYASAVAAGRVEAGKNPYAHFIDDEHSIPLFLGYSVAALRLKDQLQQTNIAVDAEHPLFVYIPCGVGGAPGGITFGLKQVFGDHVHCFFAEPVDAPCMLVQLALGEKDKPLSVYDISLKNQTEADGLAVARASQMVADCMRPLLSGIFTVPDKDLFRYLYQLHQTESLKVEPSATAAFAGLALLLNSEDGQRYLQHRNLAQHMAQATHILWTTGGAFVPDDEYKRFWRRGLASR